MIRMGYMMLQGPKKIQDDLDPNFISGAREIQAYRRLVAEAGDRARNVGFAVHQVNDIVSRFDYKALPGYDARTRKVNNQIGERLFKYILWQRGGWKAEIGGSRNLAQHIMEEYGEDGEHSWDAEFMGNGVFKRPFEIKERGFSQLPESNERYQKIGGHYGGCRIGIDLGNSDYKLSAVIDGKEVFRAESSDLGLEWDPNSATDVNYMIEKINEGIAAAATFLPRIDAIGISTAGIVVDNEYKLGSLIKDLPSEAIEYIPTIFREVQSKWGVPLVVRNDGDVSALGAAESLGLDTCIGLAGGSSVAAAAIFNGQLNSWFHELAFPGMDFHPFARLQYKWDSDERGAAECYLPQLALPFLVQQAGLTDVLDLKMDETDKNILRPALIELIGMAEEGKDQRVINVFEQYGKYYGHFVAMAGMMYDNMHDAFLFGKVTEGAAGDIAVPFANAVLNVEFPELEMKLHVADSESRATGQAYAAAGLAESVSGQSFSDPEITKHLAPAIKIR